MSRPWTRELLEALGRQSPELARLFAAAPRVHLAIMREPFASYIVDGSKRVESRWTRGGACPPHFRVGAGDVIVWKRSGGAVFGGSVVHEAQTFRVRSDAHAAELHRTWAQFVRVDPELPPVGRKIATFIRLAERSFIAIAATVPCGKQDRSGWNILADRTTEAIP